MSFVDNIAVSSRGASVRSGSDSGARSAPGSVRPSASPPPSAADTVSISATARAMAATAVESPAPPPAAEPVQVRVSRPAIPTPAAPMQRAAVPENTADQAIERESSPARSSSRPASGGGEVEEPREGARAQREAVEDAERRSAAPTDRGAESMNAQVQRMRVQEREVRHTQVIKAAVGGTFAGNSTYHFARGPDGRRYIVGGDVSFDVSPVENNPRATISKMQRIRA
ncbi:MAG: putative metalloprotease CJM1_0395 family protein, partial [Nannocystaceae bacterium]